MNSKPETYLFRKRISGCFFAVLAACFFPLNDAYADEETAPAAEYSGMAPQICLGCHGESGRLPAHQVLETSMASKANPDAPFGEGNHSCESCHGPSKIHVMNGGQKPPGLSFDSSATPEQKNSVCMNCHQDEGRFHWPGSTHNLEAVACVDCHSVHVENDPVLDLETQPAVCFTCHKEQRAQFLRQSRHPVQAATGAWSHTGLLSCNDCHNAHGSDGPGLLKQSTVNESCYDCHAEKRGPFLWQHQPVSEDCSSCHTPHGSNYPNLLSGRTPWLCQQCHSTRNHPSSVLSGIDIPPVSMDRRVVGKDCMNCHASVHGSNHPSGAGLTR